MKNGIQFFIILCLPSLIFAQTFEWAKSFGSSGNENANSIVTDKYGNVYVQGLFNSPTMSFGLTTLVNNGGTDIYIAKLNAGGNLIWAKSIGGDGEEYDQSICVDSAGNFYITGSYSSTTLNIGSARLVNKGSGDVFIAKYDSGGNALWAKSVGGNGYEAGESIAMDAMGNVVVVGTFQSSTITFGSNILTKSALDNLFISKYDSSGNVLWAKSIAGGGGRITADAKGNVYVTGNYLSTLTVGSNILTSKGLQDLFTVKYDLGGNVVWAKNLGGTANEEAKSISSDAKGNIYILGSYASPVLVFGSSNLNNYTMNDTTIRIFLAKYDSSGNELWARSSGKGSSRMSVEGYSITSKSTENIYIAGNYHSTNAFLAFGSISLPGNNSSNVFIAQYDSGGNALWAKSVLGNSYSIANALEIDRRGNLYLAGAFSLTMNFPTTTLTSAGGDDMFIGKYNFVPLIQIPPVKDSIKSGTTYNITWSVNNVKTVDITYTINNGGSWINVATGIDAGSGSYQWLVPIVSPPSSQCKLRIAKSNDSTTFSLSDIFTVYAKVNVPTFSVSAGAYAVPQTITIASTSNDAKIFYTLDGSMPSEQSIPYTSQIPIDTTTTLKAKAFKTDWVGSDIKSSTYTILPQSVAVSYNVVDTWLDVDFDGKETKTISPTINISYGSIVAYQWTVNGLPLRATKDLVATLPTGTWYLLLTMTTDRGITKKDSVKISVYSAAANIGGSIESAVSQLNNNVYFVTSKGGSIYRIDSTGTIAWNILTGGAIQSTTCVTRQENIYVGSNDTRLYSFDYQGAPRWDKSMGGNIISSPSTSANGLIYVGISTGRMFALDEAGNIKWNVQTGGVIQSSPSIDENDIAYFGSNDSKLYAVSSSGNVLWTYASGGPIRTSPALGSDSSIVFGSDDGLLYKLNKNGNLIWMFPTGGSVKASPIIGVNGVVYCGSSNGKIYSISREGNKLWEYNAGSAVGATPSLGPDGSIYFGTMRGDIISLNQDGIMMWNLQTGKPIVAPMLVTGARVLMVGDTLGTVYILKIPENSIIASYNPKINARTTTVSSGSFEWWTFKGNNQRTGIRESIFSNVDKSVDLMPEKFVLSQNFPNPFNPSTTIRYGLPSSSRVSLRIYNILGQQIADLVNTEQSAGWYETQWNATGASGLYFYRIDAVCTSDPNQRFTQLKKMMLIK